MGIIQRIAIAHNKASDAATNKVKYEAELEFWKVMLNKYQGWYCGELDELYGEPAPSADHKIIASTPLESALLTWTKIHQQAKYLQDLMLGKNVFAGMKILDVGSGPLPSASVFEQADLYCLDPLLPGYMEIGYPLACWHNVSFVGAFCEKMPFPDDCFDGVISVNAIDHVDNFILAAQEIKRVIKKDGKIRLHVHYHQKKATEPLELNDAIVGRAFAWCRGFNKIHESKRKRGHALTKADESYAVWSNF